MLDMEVVWTLVGLISMLLLDTVLGVSLALRRGEFSWAEIARTLKTNVLPYVVSLAAMGAVASFSHGGGGAMTGFFLTFAGLYSVKLISDLGAKVKELFGVEVK